MLSGRDTRLNLSNSLGNVLKKYRLKVYCVNCGANYVTRLLDGTTVRRCKICGSEKINRKRMI